MQPIVYTDTSAIRPGKLQEFQMGMQRLAAFVDAHVPRLLSYGFFLEEDRTQMTVVAVHPDSASLGFHLDVGGPEFRKIADLIDLVRIDVYGQVSASVVDRLHQKARMPGRGTVVVHECYVGSTRGQRRTLTPADAEGAAHSGYRHGESSAVSVSEPGENHGNER